MDFQEDKSEEVKDEEDLSRALLPIGQNLREWEEEFFSHFLEKIQGLLRSPSKERYFQFVLDLQETTIGRASICLGNLRADLVALNMRYQSLEVDSEEENSDREEAQADEAGEDEDN